MNNQETQEVIAAFEASQQQHVQQIADRLNKPQELPSGQPFYIDHGNQVWGPEGLYCECLEHATQQICDALNILSSALFY